MSRYIDAEPIEKFIENGLNTGIFGHDAIEITTEIHFAPTADVVEVVRCKDCKYYADLNYNGKQFGTWCSSSLHATIPDGFCHHGKRKEKQEEASDEEVH